MSQWTSEELAELEDPDTWDREHPQVVTRRGPAQAVVGVRFEAAEFQALAHAARAAGKTTTEFIHDTVLAALG